MRVSATLPVGVHFRGLVESPFSCPGVNQLTTIIRSPAIRGAAIYAAGGVGFAGANLILARALEPVEFATFALTVAIVNLAQPTAPLGIDGVIVRHQLPVTRGLLQRLLAVTALVATAALLLGGFLYELSPVALLAAFGAVLAGGTIFGAAAVYQSRQRFDLSVPLSQTPNIALLIVALFTVMVGVQVAWVPLIALALLLAAIGAVAWGALSPRPAPARVNAGLPWREALAYAGAHAGLFAMTQLDRLLIPHVLPLEELARYAVLAAIVGSAFRVLAMAVGHTLIPQMRVAADVEERRLLLRREATIVGALLIAGPALLWFLAPALVHLIAGDKYRIDSFLVFAALFTGVARVLGAFTRSPVVALGSERELFRLNVLGWGSSAIAVACGAVGARWGLAGMLLGVSAGWWAWAVVAGVMSLKHLRGEVLTPLPHYEMVNAEQLADNIAE